MHETTPPIDDLPATSSLDEELNSMSDTLHAISQDASSPDSLKIKATLEKIDGFLDGEEYVTKEVIDTLRKECTELTGSPKSVIPSPSKLP